MDLLRENSLIGDAIDSMKVELSLCCRNLLNLNVGPTKMVVKLT